jgi:hypothetical protein
MLLIYIVKSTYLASKISHRQISKINVKATQIKMLRLSFLWKILLMKIQVVSPEKWGMEAGKLWIFCGFHVHFASFSVWNLAFLGNVWAFHLRNMWILTTSAFHSPKVHFHGGNANIFPLWRNQLTLQEPIMGDVTTKFSENCWKPVQKVVIRWLSGLWGSMVYRTQVFKVSRKPSRKPKGFRFLCLKKSRFLGLKKLSFRVF